MQLQLQSSHTGGQTIATQQSTKAQPQTVNTQPQTINALQVLIEALSLMLVLHIKRLKSLGGCEGVQEGEIWWGVRDWEW